MSTVPHRIGKAVHPGRMATRPPGISRGARKPGGTRVSRSHVGMRDSSQAVVSAARGNPFRRPRDHVPPACPHPSFSEKHAADEGDGLGWGTRGGQVKEYPTGGEGYFRLVYFCALLPHRGSECTCPSYWWCVMIGCFLHVGWTLRVLKTERESPAGRSDLRCGACTIGFAEEVSPNVFRF